MQKLELFQTLGAMQARSNVLDIGSSNLYSATEDALHRFISYYGNDVPRDGIDQFVERISKGSTYGPAGGTNESFAGELLERAGLKYLSLDIADGYRTKIFDLNRRALEQALHGTFDTVINCGTTEHVLNQINAFNVIHDATKVGGYMIHELPSLGYVDHGYVRYTPQFFFDLAAYNGYDIVLFEYQGPLEGKNIYSALKSYAQHFASVSKAIRSAPEQLASVSPSDISVLVVFQKKKDERFVTPVETRTSVGTIDINEANLTSSISSILSTRQLYKVGALALSAAVRRTPTALARAIARTFR